MMVKFNQKFISYNEQPYAFFVEEDLFLKRHSLYEYILHLLKYWQGYLKISKSLIILRW